MSFSRFLVQTIWCGQRFRLVEREPNSVCIENVLHPSNGRRNLFVQTHPFHFMSRNARNCITQYLHSHSILCTAFEGLSRNIETALRCPRPESLSWMSLQTGSKHCFSDRSRWKDCRCGWFSLCFRNSRECSNPQLASQRNVAIRVFRIDVKLVLPFSETWHVSPQFCRDSSSLPHWNSCCHKKNVQTFPVNGALLFEGQHMFSQLCHNLGLDLVCLGTFRLLRNFFLWLSNNFWTQICHPIKWWRDVLVCDFSNVYPDNFRDTKLNLFRGEWLRSWQMNWLHIRHGKWTRRNRPEW